MTQKQLRERVLEWINATGHQLEMQVARQFRRSDTQFVEQSSYYTDTITGTIREIDVIANWVGIGQGGIWVNAMAVIECKSFSKGREEKPWVLFTDGLQDDELGSDFSLALLPKKVDENPAGAIIVVETPVERAAPELLEDVNKTCYALSQMSTSKNERDPAYDAARQVISAAFGVLDSAANPAATTYRCAIPVIVTNNPMFTCSLDENGEIDLVETTRERLIAPSGRGLEYVLVHVVHVSALPSFIEECSELAKADILGEPKTSIANARADAGNDAKNF